MTLLLVKRRRKHERWPKRKSLTDLSTWLKSGNSCRSATGSLERPSCAAPEQSRSGSSPLGKSKDVVLPAGREENIKDRIHSTFVTVLLSLPNSVRALRQRGTVRIFLHFASSKPDRSLIFFCTDFTALLSSGLSSVFASRCNTNQRSHAHIVLSSSASNASPVMTVGLRPPS